MALQTKTYTSETSSKSFALKLTLTENSVSTTDNTSSVTYKLELISGGYNFSDYSHGYKVTLGGTVVAELTQVAYENQISIDANSALTIASGTATIAHDSDGGLDMSVAFTFYTEYTGTLSGSGTMPLTQIASGLVYIGNGSSYDAYEVYIGNGTSWDKYIPYIGNGSSWDNCS